MIFYRIKSARLNFNFKRLSIFCYTLSFNTFKSKIFNNPIASIGRAFSYFLINISEINIFHIGTRIATENIGNKPVLYFFDNYSHGAISVYCHYKNVIVHWLFILFKVLHKVYGRNYCLSVGWKMFNGLMGRTGSSKHHTHPRSLNLVQVFTGIAAGIDTRYQ